MDRTKSGIICLDAEFADSTNNEILELSVYGEGRDEIFHGYFRPVRTRSWKGSERVHHITPAMVADKPSFASMLGVIQPLFDAADIIIGFAPGNDITHLEASGVEGLDTKRVVDVREWYWFLIGRHNGVDYYGVPGLAAVAAEMGVEFEAGAEHSASGDTEVTFKVFDLLESRFAAEYPGVEGEDERQLIARFAALCGEAVEEYERGKARGYVYLVRKPGGYRLKVSGRSEAPDDCVASIEVADRHKAEYDLSKLWRRREAGDRPHLYRLTDRDIDTFRAYANEYDAGQSRWYRSLMRNRGRLGL